MPRSLSSSSHSSWTMGRGASYDPYGGGYAGYPSDPHPYERQVGQLYYHPHYGGIGDPGIHPPVFIAPRLVVPQTPERFRFVTWGSSGFVDVSGWRKSGFDLCSAAAGLRVSYPVAVLYLVSSTRGWLSQSGATGDQWFSFLGCALLPFWANMGEGPGWPGPGYKTP